MTRKSPIGATTARVLAGAAGLVLAAGLALATTQTPEELATRNLSILAEDSSAGDWKDWHPDAVHSLTVKYGMGLADEHYAYAVSDWAGAPNWRSDPEIAKYMDGYVEHERSEPELTATPDEGGLLIMAISRVQYTWDGHSGQMVQTDRFRIITAYGRPVIRALDTVLDYR